MTTAQHTPGPTIYGFDLDGTEFETRTFDEHHAIRLEESHDAAGIWHTRDAAAFRALIAKAEGRS